MNPLIMRMLALDTSLVLILTVKCVGKGAVIFCTDEAQVVSTFQQCWPV